jgi:hypothetical protein
LAISHEHHTFRVTGQYDADTHVLNARLPFMHGEQPLTAFVIDRMLKPSVHATYQGPCSYPRIHKLSATTFLVAHAQPATVQDISLC